MTMVVTMSLKEVVMHQVLGPSSVGEGGPGDTSAVMQDSSPEPDWTKEQEFSEVVDWTNQHDIFLVLAMELPLMPHGIT